MENNKSTTIFHGLFSYRLQKWRQNVQNSSGTRSRRGAASFELVTSFLWSIIVPTMKNWRLFFCFVFCFVCLFFFFNNTDVHVSWEIITAEQALQTFLFILIFFLSKAQRYIDGGRHLKSKVQDGGDSTIVRTAKFACFAVYNRRQNCWDGITWGNKTIHTPPQPCPFIVGVFLVFNR